MAITRSYNNAFEVVDRTEEINIIPNTWGLINELGLFGKESVSQHTVTLEQTESTAGLIVDRVRGERSNVAGAKGRKLHAFAIPHFPLDDAITTQDIQGKRAYGSDNAETIDAVRARKMEQLRESHAWTQEFARAKLITSGDVYAPNGTVVENFYDAFGVTQKSIDFDLTDDTTNVNQKVEEVIRHIRTNLKNGGMATGVLVLASPSFFDAYVNHPAIKEAYKFYSSTQEPARNRLGGMGLYRRFVHYNVEMIEYGGAYEGQELIPDGKAYFIPQGVSNLFTTFYGPADKLDLANTLGEEVYMFEYVDPRGGRIDIETESNFLNIVRYPQVVVEASA